MLPTISPAILFAQTSGQMLLSLGISPAWFTLGLVAVVFFLLVVTSLTPDVVMTLQCPRGHRFDVRWPIVEHAVQVPRDEYCPVHGIPGRLVKAERR